MTPVSSASVALPAAPLGAAFAAGGAWTLLTPGLAYGAYVAYMGSEAGKAGEAPKAPSEPEALRGGAEGAQAPEPANVKAPAYVAADPEDLAAVPARIKKKTPRAAKCAIVRLQTKLAEAQAEIERLRADRRQTVALFAEATNARAREDDEHRKTLTRNRELEGILDQMKPHIDVAVAEAKALKAGHAALRAEVNSLVERLEESARGKPGEIRIEPLVAWSGQVASAITHSRVASFRAYVHVPEVTDDDGSEAFVTSEPESIVSGEGRTPQEALVAMTEALGLAALKGSMLGNRRDTPPEPPPVDKEAPPAAATPTDASKDTP